MTSMHASSVYLWAAIIPIFYVFDHWLNVIEDLYCKGDIVRGQLSGTYFPDTGLTDREWGIVHVAELGEQLKVNREEKLGGYGSGFVSK